MAASVIMDMMQRILVKEGEKEVQDIFRGERVESVLVGSEVAVVYINSTRDQAVVVVTLGEVAGLMMITTNQTTNLSFGTPRIVV